MITKLFNIWLHPSTGSGTRALQGIDHDKFEAFYTNLATGINNLEKELGNSHFSVAWLLRAMQFVRSLHSSLFLLIEEVWLPMRKTVGIDVLEMYFSVSMKLLEMCNYLRDGVSQLEYTQLCLEHCLTTFGSIIDNLPQEKDVMGSCKRELEKVESKTNSNLWVDMISKFKMTGGDKSSSRKQQDLLIERSHSALPSPSLSKQAFEISQVMADSQLVTTFISCLLLWVLTDTSEQFSSAHNLDGLTMSIDKADSWAAALLSIKGKIENSELKHKRSNCSLSLEEIRIVHSSLRDLIEGAEMENIEADGENRSTKLRTMLEQTKEKLDEMIRTSEKLSEMTNDIFSEILQCQEKLMKVVENQLLRSVTI